MEYSITALSIAKNEAKINIKQSSIDFGTTKKTAEQLPNPAELFLGAFAACLLKNVERFSGLLHFNYDHANLTVSATRLENPPRMDKITYELTIFSKDKKLQLELLQKNLEKYGTIFNTVKLACAISGSIKREEDYV